MAEEDNELIENDHDPDFTEPDSTVTEPISASNSGEYGSAQRMCLKVPESKSILD